MGLKDWLFGDEVNPSRYDRDKPYNAEELARIESSGYSRWVQSLDLKVGEAIPGTSSLGRIEDPLSGPYHNLRHSCGADIAFTSRSPVHGERFRCPHCGVTSTIRSSGNSFVFS